MTYNTDLDERLRVAAATNTGAISTSLVISDACYLHSVTCKFSSAPTTSENFVVTKNSVNGAAYDVPLLSEDPSSAAVTSIVQIWAEGEVVLQVGDSVDVTFTNTDARTYGVEIIASIV